MARKRKAMTKKGVPGGDDDAGIGHNGGEPAELTDEERRQLFASHRSSWNGWMAKSKALKELEKDVKAALKSDGFTVKQMQIADDLADVKGEAKVKAEVDDRLRVARWVGHPLGAQLDLFEQPDRTPITDRAYEEGRQCSIDNKPAKPKYAPETEAYGSYMAGYHDHQREIVGGMKAPATADQSTMAHRE